MRAAHQEADECLNRLWLPNVFNYPTERALLDAGLASRGSADRLEAARRRLVELEKRVASEWQRRREVGQMIIAALLAVLTVLQIKETLFEWLSGWGISMGMRWLILLVLALAFGAVVWLLSRRGIPRSEHT